MWILQINSKKMPCYGESCCDFCGVQVAATLDDDDDDDDQRYIQKYDQTLYGWLATAEVIDKYGKLYENMEPNLMYELEKDDHKFTNTCLHWVKEGSEYQEGVFLHSHCRKFIQNSTGWTLDQIYDNLRKDRHPFVYDDHQGSIFEAIEDGLVESWRAIVPDKNEQNYLFFQQRIIKLIDN